MSQNVEFVRDKSGSCGIVCLLTEREIFVANIGDSRAIISGNRQRELRALTNDHKPSEDGEQRRIL